MIPLLRQRSKLIAAVTLLGGAASNAGSQEVKPEEGKVAQTSTEQGQVPLSETFELERRWRLEKRRDAFHDTQYRVHLRSMYLGRDKYDYSESEAAATGGWAGLKTGYFFDHLSLGLTGYTSQHLYGDEDKDGTSMLAPGQEGYTVLGELYADFRILDDLNLYIGRKEYDTPFINRNDTRMTPNTFEAISIHGRTELDDGATFKWGAGYFDAIKERNSDEFVSMSVDAGTSAERGVYSAGGVYQKGDFSFGMVDYYSPDVVNIGYAEAKLTVKISEDWKPRFAAQFIDQRSVGSDLLMADGDSQQQFGIKAELPVGNALFTTAYTNISGDGGIQSPWSAYPGYTGAQVEDFNRAGESAILLRAGYEFPWLKGLSAYALWVHGLDAKDAFARDEYDFNLQWAPPEGVLKGFSIRVRYALIEERGTDSNDCTDFRVLCNYAIPF